MAINKDGQLFTWGCGYFTLIFHLIPRFFGALGLGSETSYSVPTLVESLKHVKMADGGSFHSIVVTGIAVLRVSMY